MKIANPGVAMRTALAATLVVLAAWPAPRAIAAEDLAVVARAERGRAVAPVLPRGAFVLRYATSSVMLSPDGRHVAWLSERGRNRELWLRATGGGAPRRLVGHTPARALAWSRDGRWLFLESPDHMFALATAGQGGSGIATTLGGTQRREFVRMDDAMPAAAIVREGIGTAPRGGPLEWRLVRVDADGRRTLLHRDRHRILGHALDPRGRLAFVQRVEGVALVVHRIEPDGRTREVLRCEGIRQCTPLATSDDGRALTLRTNVAGDTGDGERTRLARLGADGVLRTLHADPRGEADLDALAFDPATRQPLIAAYRSTVATIHGLDADSRRHVARLQARWPRHDLRIAIGRGPDARWLVEIRAGDQQGARWHLYDPRTGATSPLFDDDPLLARAGTPTSPIPAAALARRVPVTWHASDGMALHGFVHLPPGRDAATRPLVTMVHGGPWNHARPEFNGFAQFLANRGYVVFEPNFRGSTGHGRAYMFAADGDFGNGRVQRDIVEGTRHLLASGIGDARRVGIVGASFGGYATLLGTTFQPGLFKVGVAFVPPPDFAWTLRWVLRNPESLELGRTVPMPDMLRMLSLDTDDRARMASLHAQSPLANVARMDRPLLLVAGGEDRRVGIAGVIEYAARLKLAGKDVSLLVDTDAGHSNREPVAREANLYLLETMLHRHLGGPAPQPADAVLRGYVADTLRLCGPGLRPFCAPAAGGVTARRAPRPTGG